MQSKRNILLDMFTVFFKRCFLVIMSVLASQAYTSVLEPDNPPNPPSWSLCPWLPWLAVEAGLIRIQCVLNLVMEIYVGPKGQLGKNIRIKIISYSQCHFNVFLFQKSECSLNFDLYKSVFCFQIQKGIPIIKHTRMKPKKLFTQGWFN